jgi:hypothetical protein
MVNRSAKVVEFQSPLRCAELVSAEIELEEDDRAWATRAGMWQSRAAKALARRTKRAKAQPALILAGHGVSLRIENGALTIQNGFTHYPQKREIIRYFRGDIALPERIILLDGSGSISFDVLSWKPKKMLGREMNSPLDNYEKNRSDNYHARKINSSLR